MKLVPVLEDEIIGGLDLLKLLTIIMRSIRMMLLGEPLISLLYFSFCAGP